jgi:hypothetical protein
MKHPLENAGEKHRRRLDDFGKPPHPKHGLTDTVPKRKTGNDRQEHTDSDGAIDTRPSSARRKIEVHRCCPETIPRQKAIAQTPTIAA